jgi:hypothetical protein
VLLGSGAIRDSTPYPGIARQGQGRSQLIQQTQVVITEIDPSPGNVAASAYQTDGGTANDWVVQAVAICARLAG